MVMVSEVMEELSTWIWEIGQTKHALWMWTLVRKVDIPIKGADKNKMHGTNNVISAKHKDYFNRDEFTRDEEPPK